MFPVMESPQSLSRRAARLSLWAASTIEPRRNMEYATEPLPRYVLRLSLDSTSVIDLMYMPIYTLLKKHASLPRLTRLNDLFEELRKGPDAVLITDAALAKPRNRPALILLLNYVRAGGVAVCMATLGGSERQTGTWPDSFFKEAGLGWRTTTVCSRTGTFLNVNGVPNRLRQHLPPGYAQEALFISGATTEESWYLGAGTDAAAAVASVGKGQIAYVGDIKGEEETDIVVAQMCLNLRYTRERAPDKSSDPLLLGKPSRQFQIRPAPLPLKPDAKKRQPKEKEESETALIPGLSKPSLPSFHTQTSRFIPQEDAQLHVRSSSPMDAACQSISRADTPAPWPPSHAQMSGAFETCCECHLTWLVTKDHMVARSSSHPFHNARVLPDAPCERSILVKIDGVYAVDHANLPGSPTGVGVYFGGGSKYNVAEAIKSDRHSSQLADLASAETALRVINKRVVPDFSHDFVEYRRRPGQGLAHGDEQRLSRRGLRNCRVILQTNSTYLVETFCRYRNGWGKNEQGTWVNKKSGKTLKLSDEVENVQKQIDALARSDVKVVWYKVGKQHNTAPDQMAREVIGLRRWWTCV